MRVRLQESFDPAKVNALKRFHQEFFDSANAGTDPRSVGAASVAAFGKESAALQVLTAQASRYPFLAALVPVADRISKLAERDYAFLLNQLTDFHDDLLDAKQDVLDPIKTFMAGRSAAAYDEAMAYLREEEANFADLTSAAVQPLRDLAASEAPYRGQVLPAAKTCSQRRLQAAIAQALFGDESARRPLPSVDEREAQLRATPEFKALPDGSVTQVLADRGRPKRRLQTLVLSRAIRRPGVGATLRKNIRRNLPLLPLCSLP
jgi:hypothetical protein